MRNFVIVGGTDGMGRALARHYVSTGDAVMVVGRNAAKGKAFLAEAGPTRATGPISYRPT